MRKSLALVIPVAVLLWTGAADRTDAGVTLYSKAESVQRVHYRQAVYFTAHRSKLDHSLAMLRGI